MNIFQTQNVALAITLATCGVPFAKDTENGTDYPFVHIYDVEVIRKLADSAGRPLFAGWPLEAAAAAAYRAGLRGLIVYNFQRTPICERVIKAYNNTGDRIASAAQGGPAVALTLNIEPEDAAALCAQFTANRNTFLHGWKTRGAFLHIPGKSHQGTENGKTVIVGSFRLVPLNLDAKR